MASSVLSSSSVLVSGIGSFGAGKILVQPSKVPNSRVLRKASRLFTTCNASNENSEARPATRREIILQSSSAALLASVFHFSGTRPSYLGFERKPPSLALCPPTPNCISTAEEINDPGHYTPPWNYNPEDGRGRKGSVSRKQAMDELVSVLKSTKPDDFMPTVIKQTDDYVYVEYESPLMGFVDDVEFWFPPGDRPIVEYRSASRLGESDLDINRKRIKFLRQELQKKGWASVGL